MKHEPATPETTAALSAGQRILIEATVNELRIKPDQPLVGVRIYGGGRIIHISVPRECITDAQP